MLSPPSVDERICLRVKDGYPVPLTVVQVWRQQETTGRSITFTVKAYVPTRPYHYVVRVRWEGGAESMVLMGPEGGSACDVGSVPEIL